LVPPRFVRAIKQATGRDVPMVMAFGAEAGRLHVHAALAAADENETERIRSALLTAAGEWASSRSKDHQLHMQPLGTGGPIDRWAKYLAGNAGQARAIGAGSRPWSVNNPARRRAKILHAQIGKKVNRRRPKLAPLPPEPIATQQLFGAVPMTDRNRFL
jgi:hypothetical protein